MPLDPRVLLTRAPGDNEALARRLADAGIASLAIPCVRTVALDDPNLPRAALLALASSDLLVVTSRAGARAVAAALGGDRFHVPVAAVGRATADACLTAGLTVVFVPSEPSGTALAEELPLPDGVILMARSAQASPEPVEILRRRGATVGEIIAYRTEPVAPVRIPLADAVVFASPSAVNGFAGSGAPVPRIVVANGRTTATRIRERLRVDPLVAAPDDISIAAVIQAALGGRHVTAGR